MGLFCKELQEIQSAKSFSNSKAFYVFLSERGLSCNYQHFMKIIKAESRPSVDFVDEISRILKKDGERLVLAYCQDSFPKQKHLFSFEQTTAVDEVAEVVTLTKTKTLTVEQVHLLTQSKENYFLFVLATLARRPLIEQELTQYFSEKDLVKSIATLQKGKLLIETENGIQTASSEIVFPAAETSLKAAYAQMDLWDAEFGQEMELQTTLQKRFLRRISARYFNVIVKHFDLLFDTIRTSDELDVKFNDEVIQMVVELKRGQLPG